MNNYLDRYGHPLQLIHTKPHSKLGIVVVIPCHNEPDLILSLQSLQNCQGHSCSVEIIVIINQAINCDSLIDSQNEIAFKEASEWSAIHSNEKTTFHIHKITDLPQKHAGVGLARKIGMDEAVRRFELKGSQDGIIACFDADSLCQSNYLKSIQDHFYKFSTTPGCSIYYEHPLEGELDSWNYDAITDYELFLRYYVHALRFAGYPFAFQTVGSSMAVRSSIYQKQGGMNRRKAGEDFYFLQKIIPLGGFTEIKDTTVIPSARESDRVPFGTGKSVSEWRKSHHLEAYSPQTFVDLKRFIGLIDILFTSNIDECEELLKTLPTSIGDFLESKDFNSALSDVKSKTKSLETFKQRLFSWFDALKVLKYVHFSRDNFFPNIPVLEASIQLLILKDCPKFESQSAKDILLIYRGLDLK